MTGPTWHPKTGTSYVSPATCPCTYGPCGHCSTGDHEKCLWLRDPAEAALRAAQTPTTWIMDRRGIVPTFPNGKAATVYLDRAGAHIWRCPCHLDGHGPDYHPEPQQLSLFGEVNA